MKNKIDVVILWVDGNDKKWQKEKSKYTVNKDCDVRNIRYRDWDNLKYLFRSIENNMPWVNKVHFVTYGHLPTWLNTSCSKLNIVNHKDFIPQKYLPTFNCNPIENNLHRIKDLSEQFVYFNDDMFVINKTKPTDFFKDGKPCDSAILNATISHRENNNFIEAADMAIINSHFNKKRVILNNFSKWFNLKYGKQLIRTFCLLPWNEFPGIWHSHIANSYLKSTYKEVWSKEYDVLDETCSHKFRYALDVNQWLFEDWQIVTGNFIPRKANFGRSFALSDDEKNNERVYNILKKKKFKLVCINDMVSGENFDEIKDELNSIFSNMFPEKSIFEI